MAQEPYQDPWNIGAHYPTLREHADAFVDMAPHVDTLVKLASECKVILELGVRSGVSAWAFLTGLPEDGMLVAVDHDKRVLDKRWVPPQVSNDERFMYLEGDDLDKFMVVSYPRPDLAFIDTSHEYVHTYAELVVCAGLGSGLIALHDYALETVKLAVDQFLELRPDYEVLFIEESQWGLIVLQHTTRRSVVDDAAVS